MELESWAGLPMDLLQLVVERLFSMSDYVRFSAVCKSWLSIALDQKQSRLKSCNKHLPMLMIPTKDNSDEERSLYSIAQEGEGKFYNFKLRVPFNKRCCGSSYGWLAIAEKHFVITLINPFTGETFCLPPIREDKGEFGDVYHYCVKKVAFSSNPSLLPRHDDFMVVAIFGGKDSLAFIRPGKSEGWTLLQHHLPKHLKYFGSLHDVIFYKDNQIYAVNQRGVVLCVNFDTQSNRICPFKLKVVVPTYDPRSYYLNSYLVESSARDLLLVHRFMIEKDDDFQFTVSFKVFKMVSDSEEGRYQWVEIQCLTGGDALFLGDNQSMCVPALRFPSCQPNCIYYTDDDFTSCYYEPHGPHDMGVFNLEDASIGTHYTLDSSQKHMPPALWIVPSYHSG